MSDRKRAGIVMACIVVAVAVVIMTTSCVPPTYTLDVSANPSGGGSVSPSGGEYEAGEQVTLAATPASGYAFDYWSGGASNTTSSITITMDSDKSLTANFWTIPPLEFTTAGTGGVAGKLRFPDYTPADGSAVYIFESGETRSFAGCSVDAQGDYVFDNLPVGSYEIYATSNLGAVGFTGPPHATMDIWEHETTIVPTLIIRKHFLVLLDDPKRATDPDHPGSVKHVIDGHNPEFTWNDVQNAAYYVVTISSNDADDGDYEEYQQVVDTMIVWSTSLSSLPYQEFRIDVDAYMEDGTQLGGGSREFAVDNPPEGWVYE
jgi:hypothetical protein